ncbi:hypothetical protein C1E47_15720 [Vibrio cholerae]|uniref:hypothetical protein n=1 Tax=Vibrio cholerae TaxID=666 RepID=UPI001A1962CC|nr:hypothetical protein [Vibrio cholerae]EII3728696.1 hypothetical protein [Vibrio cholerae]EMA3788864.1 hypothetical protein [Vibrio cholerae]HAS5424191.1 hypothetical protein [Vibrio cholerae]
MKTKHIVVIKSVATSRESALTEAARLASNGYIDPIAKGSIHHAELPKPGEIYEGRIEISSDLKRMRFIGLPELAFLTFPISHCNENGKLNMLALQEYVNEILEMNTCFVGFSYFTRERSQEGVFILFNVGFIAG